MNENKLIVCSKTVMDTTDPNIVFNKEGESNYYTNFVNNMIYFLVYFCVGKFQTIVFSTQVQVL